MAAANVPPRSTTTQARPSLGAIAPAAEDDPVAAAGREAVRLDRRQDALEERAFASPEPLRGRLLAEADRVRGRMCQLEDAATALRARTLEGAMFQLGLAMTDAEVLEGYVPGGAEDLIGRVRANLYSVLAVLERAAEGRGPEAFGVPRAEVLSERYMPARFDPHAEAFAEVPAGEAAS